MKRPVIIDTDPGIDDVIAITAALFAEELDVRLITTVGGNVDIERTTRNALDLVHFLGKRVPVAKGAAGPMVQSPREGAPVHGSSGIGDYRFPKKADVTVTGEHAIIAMRNAILQSEEPITLVTIGPLTNIALMLNVFPETRTGIEEIVLMGGAVEGGNATPVSEFNIYADPHAAKVVFASEIPVVMCGLDVTRQTSVTWDDVLSIQTYGQTGEMVAAMLEHYTQTYSKKAITIHDLCTIFYLTRPELFRSKRADVHVVTEGETAGCTMVYFQEQGNVAVCVEADNDAFRKAFVSVFREIDGSREEEW